MFVYYNFYRGDLRLREVSSGGETSMKKRKHNDQGAPDEYRWREPLGWAIIILFSYVYLFEINSWELLANRRMNFPFLVAATFFSLSWLWLSGRNNIDSK